jgi:heme/copper-type cytochrome/quinol oxidase subunit 2
MATAPPTVRSTGLVSDAKSYVDWPALLAGGVFASALTFVLFTFGSGLGLSMVSPEPGEGASLRWLTIAAGLWFIWVAVSSFAAGGYLTGRLRRRIGDATYDGVEVRDGAHGVLVWAAGALIGMILAAAGVGGVVGMAVQTAGNAAEIVVEEADYFSGRILRSDDGDVVGDQAVRDEVAVIVGRALTVGEASAADRAHLARILVAETGATLPVADAQVDGVLTEVEVARQQAIEAADQARIVGLIAAFVLAATMLVSAAAAYFAAIRGGQHRDDNVPFGTFTTVRHTTRSPAA